MTHRSVTHLLVSLLLAAAVAVGVAYVRLQASMAAAAAAERDLRVCQADLSDLAAWHVLPSGGGGVSSSADAEPALARQVRRAAAVAGVADRLVSVEPGPPIPVGDGGVVRTPVYLRFDGVTLGQTVAFLHDLSAPAGGPRATGIDLSAPAGPPASPRRTGDGEPWTADLTVSETSAAVPPVP